MELLEKIEILLSYYKKGLLGGEFMPEDENPNLEKSSCQNYLYFTLPMALNYQRNSYTLWESANKTYNDVETRFVFDPKKVVESSFEKVQEALTKYKVALQKNKQTEVWIRLCNTIVNDFDGDVRNIFLKFHNNVQKLVIERWNQALKGTKYHPIDIHTPLWLWSRNGFKKIEKE